MLLRNSQVCYQIFNNAAKNSSFVLHLRQKMSQNGKFDRGMKYNTRLSPEQYKKKLKQCPKLSHKQFSCKKLFFKAEPKCKAITASDEYLRARQSLEAHIKYVVNFVEAESRSIMSSLESYLKKNKVVHEIQLEELFKKTTQKLDKLISLDVAYGCWMRKKTLLLNDEIKRSFDALERALVLNIKHLETMLKSLQSKVSNCITRAEKSVIAYREHDAPSAFAECMKKQFNEATKMIDRMNEEARLKLKEIAKFREMVVRSHEKTAQEVVEVNHKKVAELSEYLRRCIAKLKKSNKWWK